MRLVNLSDNLHNTSAQKNSRSTGIRGISYISRDNLYASEFKYKNLRLRFNLKLLNEAVYVRMLCEKYILYDIRYTLDDEYKNTLIDDIPDVRKLELESYVKSRIKLYDMEPIINDSIHL